MWLPRLWLLSGAGARRGEATGDGMGPKCCLYTRAAADEEEEEEEEERRGGARHLGGRGLPVGE